MSEQPKFLRDFSKEGNAIVRTELAAEIRSERKERQEGRKEKQETLAEFSALEKQLEEYNSSSHLNKIKDFLNIRAVREKLGVVATRKSELEARSLEDTGSSGKQTIESFYEEEKKRWENAEYGKEDIKQLFTEEHLASLSVDDYALLMQRFPSEMVTHVTRQGVRDHNAMYEHSAGIDEFHNGFKDLLQEKRLKSNIALRLAGKEKDQALLEVLGPHMLDEHGERQIPKSREEALEGLERNMEKYVNNTSVHFAAEAVADEYYGAERGNEIFMAYPSAFIASQYHSTGQDATMASRDIKHNDVWVKQLDDRGMNIDAALVFIPKGARVDRETGSRYEIDAAGKPIENEAAYASVRGLLAAPEFGSLAQEFMERTGNFTHDLPPPSTWEVKSGQGGPEAEAMQALIPIRERVRELMGTDDDRLLGTVLTYQFMQASRYDSGDNPALIEMRIREALGSAGIRFKEADNAVTSEEYWEQYFSSNPEQRPSKVVYYEGNDPTQALEQWKRRHGLKKSASVGNLGFDEHRFDAIDGKNWSDATRFQSLAHEVIDKRFPVAEPVAVAA